MYKNEIEMIHTNGKKIIIKDIPFVTEEKEKFHLKWQVEKLIDEINGKQRPNDVYSFKEVD
ncbi:DUF2535 family protein [Alkalihalobacterium bogoriense]|uniref:DUF2535 family protein n=1 Tax=Alkalihalobacterium bogoriense TaxID=246272 RepID=UPI00047CD631|nr:DUF2535 family protein [Alkalihalobacterium bogoriense]